MTTRLTPAAQVRQATDIGIARREAEDQQWAEIAKLIHTRSCEGHYGATLYDKKFCIESYRIKKELESHGYKVQVASVRPNSSDIPTSIIITWSDLSPNC